MRRIISREKGSARGPLVRLPLHVVLLLISAGLTLLFVFIEFRQFYVLTSNYLHSCNTSLERLKFSRARTEFSESLSQLENIAHLTVSDPQIRELLESTTQKTYSINTKMQKNLGHLLYMGKLIQPQIDSIFILTGYGAYWSGTLVPTKTRKAQFLAQYQMTDEERWHFPESPAGSSGSFTPSLANRIFYVLPFTVHEKNDCSVVVAAKSSFLTGIPEQSASVGLCSPSGSVLLNQTSFPDASLQASEPPPVLMTTELLGGLTLFFETADSSESINWRNFRLLTFLLVPLTIILAFVLSSLLSRPLVQPLKIFRKHMTISQAEREISRLRNYPLSVHEWILLTLLTTTFICCLLISVVSTRFFDRVSEEAFEASSEKLFQQAAASTENFFSSYYSATLHLGFSDMLQELLSGGASDASLSEYLEQAEGFFPYTLNLILYRPDGTLRASTAATVLPQLNLSEAPALNPGAPVWYAEQQSSDWIISLLWPLHNFSKQKQMGYFCSQIKESELSAVYHYLPADSLSAYLTLEDGTVFSSTDKQAIGRPMREDLSETLCFSQAIGKTPLTLTAVFNDASLRAQQEAMKLQMIYLLLLILILALTSSLLLSHYLSRHLNQVFQEITRLTSADLAAFSPENSIISELNEINSTFSELSQRILTLNQQALEQKRRSKELELAHQRAQFAMLQAQINPHFLYNSFEVVTSLVRQHKSSEAADMLVGISNMLRYALRSDAPLVPLEQEVRYSRTYVEIMQLRYANLLHAVFDFSDDVLGQQVPRFILQPILENAISHGFQPRGGQGSLCVMGKIAGGMLVLSVRDDGVGMEESRAAALQDSLERDAGEDGSHIGLSNIHRRLRTYGETYGLRVISHPNTGTVVILTCPLLP